MEIIKWFIQFLKDNLEIVLRIAFVRKCIVCERIVDFEQEISICDNCYKSIEFIKGRCCNVCGASLFTSEEKKDFYSENISTCYDCENETREFEKNYTFIAYDDISKKMIFDFKYKGNKSCSDDIVKIIRENFNLDFINDFDVLIPVPLHKKRKSERGFNQAEVFAKSIIKILQLENLIIDTKSLTREKNTVKQNVMSYKKRRSNLENAFKLNENNNLLGKNILIIDDIYTSGSTISECAKLVKSSGANKVCVMTITKTSKYKSDRNEKNEEQFFKSK